AGERHRISSCGPLPFPHDDRPVRLPRDLTHALVASVVDGRAEAGRVLPRCVVIADRRDPRTVRSVEAHLEVGSWMHGHPDLNAALLRCSARPKRDTERLAVADMDVLVHGALGNRTAVARR